MKTWMLGLPHLHIERLTEQRTLYNEAVLSPEKHGSLSSLTLCVTLSRWLEMSSPVSFICSPILFSWISVVLPFLTVPASGDTCLCSTSRVFASVCISKCCEADNQAYYPVGPCAVPNRHGAAPGVYSPRAVRQHLRQRACS